MPQAPYKTSRLILRDWREEDFEPFCKMNADPVVMEYFEKPFTALETAESLERIKTGAKLNGFTFWAVERRSDHVFMGTIGIFHSTYEAPFTPAVEIGWRLDRPFWNQGYATEGARESLRIGFEDYGLGEIVAITVPPNTPSRHVMEKLGMKRDLNGDFDHPRVTAGHPRQRHVLYRLKKADWQSGGI